MALLPILEYPDPRLKKVAATVTAFTPEIAKLVRDIKADVLVVGMGISGAMIAEALTADGLDVVVAALADLP